METFSSGVSPWASPAPSPRASAAAENKITAATNVLAVSVKKKNSNQAQFDSISGGSVSVNGASVSLDSLKSNPTSSLLSGQKAAKVFQASFSAPAAAASVEKSKTYGKAEFSEKFKVRNVAGIRAVYGEARQKLRALSKSESSHPTFQQVVKSIYHSSAQIRQEERMVAVFASAKRENEFKKAFSSKVEAAIASADGAGGFIASLEELAFGFRAQLQNTQDSNELAGLEEMRYKMDHFLAQTQKVKKQRSDFLAHQELARELGSRRTPKARQMLRKNPNAGLEAAKTAMTLLVDLRKQYEVLKVELSQAGVAASSVFEIKAGVTSQGLRGDVAQERQARKQDEHCLDRDYQDSLRKLAETYSHEQDEVQLLEMEILGILHKHGINDEEAEEEGEEEASTTFAKMTSSARLQRLSLRVSTKLEQVETFLEQQHIGPGHRDRQPALRSPWSQRQTLKQQQDTPGKKRRALVWTDDEHADQAQLCIGNFQQQHGVQYGSSGSEDEEKRQSYFSGTRKTMQRGTLFKGLTSPACTMGNVTSRYMEPTTKSTAGGFLKKGEGKTRATIVGDRNRKTLTAPTTSKVTSVNQLLRNSDEQSMRHSQFGDSDNSESSPHSSPRHGRKDLNQSYSRVSHKELQMKRQLVSTSRLNSIYGSDSNVTDNTELQVSDGISSDEEGISVPDGFDHFSVGVGPSTNFDSLGKPLSRSIPLARFSRKTSDAKSAQRETYCVMKVTSFGKIKEEEEHNEDPEKHVSPKDSDTGGRILLNDDAEAADDLHIGPFGSLELATRSEDSLEHGLLDVRPRKVAGGPRGNAAMAEKAAKIGTLAKALKDSQLQGDVTSRAETIAMLQVLPEERPCDPSKSVKRTLNPRTDPSEHVTDATKSPSSGSPPPVKIAACSKQDVQNLAAPSPTFDVSAPSSYMIDTMDPHDGIVSSAFCSTPEDQDTRHLDEISQFSHVQASGDSVDMLRRQSDQFIEDLRQELSQQELIQQLRVRGHMAGVSQTTGLDGHDSADQDHEVQVWDFCIANGLELGRAGLAPMQDTYTNNALSELTLYGSAVPNVASASRQSDGSDGALLWYLRNEVTDKSLSKSLENIFDKFGFLENDVPRNRHTQKRLSALQRSTLQRQMNPAHEEKSERTEEHGNSRKPRKSMRRHRQRGPTHHHDHGQDHDESHNEVGNLTVETEHLEPTDKSVRKLTSDSENDAQASSEQQSSPSAHQPSQHLPQESVPDAPASRATQVALDESESQTSQKAMEKQTSAPADDSNVQDSAKEPETQKSAEEDKPKSGRKREKPAFTRRKTGFIKKDQVGDEYFDDDEKDSDKAEDQVPAEDKAPEEDKAAEEDKVPQADKAPEEDEALENQNAPEEDKVPKEDEAPEKDKVPQPEKLAEDDQAAPPEEAEVPGEENLQTHKADHDEEDIGEYWEDNGAGESDMEEDKAPEEKKQKPKKRKSKEDKSDEEFWEDGDDSDSEEAAEEPDSFSSQRAPQEEPTRRVSDIATQSAGLQSEIFDIYKEESKKPGSQVASLEPNSLRSEVDSTQTYPPPDSSDPRLGEAQNQPGELVMARSEEQEQNEDKREESMASHQEQQHQQMKEHLSDKTSQSQKINLSGSKDLSNQNSSNAEIVLEASAEASQVVEEVRPGSSPERPQSVPQRANAPRELKKKWQGSDLTAPVKVARAKPTKARARRRSPEADVDLGIPEALLNEYLTSFGDKALRNCVKSVEPFEREIAEIVGSEQKFDSADGFSSPLMIERALRPSTSNAQPRHLLESVAAYRKLRQSRRRRKQNSQSPPAPACRAISSSATVSTALPSTTPGCQSPPAPACRATSSSATVSTALPSTTPGCGSPTRLPAAVELPRASTVLGDAPKSARPPGARSPPEAGNWVQRQHPRDEVGRPATSMAAPALRLNDALPMAGVPSGSGRSTDFGHRKENGGWRISSSSARNQKDGKKYLRGDKSPS